MTAPKAPSAVATGSPRWLVWTVIALAGLFYAYAVWNAVAHLITMAQTGLTGTGWATLLFGGVVPGGGVGCGWGGGGRGGGGEGALTFLAGLGIVAVFWMSLLALSLTLPSA